MESHTFIFEPCIWIGEGKVTFSAGSDEKLHYYTRWTVEEESKGLITLRQRVEMPSTGEELQNLFHISDISKDAFKIAIENELFGKVEGKGIINEKTLAWEFQQPGALHGFEKYEQQPNSFEYVLHAEYASPIEEFRTIIDGKIWKK